MHKILLVEDEKNFGSVLRDYLGMNGYSVTWCENGEEGIGHFKQQKYDLCVLDIMMPKKDGFTLSREMKEHDSSVPFVFLTARGNKDDVVKGYKSGADDYIVKPFDSELLLLKIKAVLNRKLNSVQPVEIIEHQIGKFRFNARMRTLKLADTKEIKMSPKESQLLHLLCEHKNDVLLREKALKQIWKDDNYFNGRSMDVYIVKLRKYLSGDATVEINNLHGNGYCLRC